MQTWYEAWGNWIDPVRVAKVNAKTIQVMRESFSFDGKSNGFYAATVSKYGDRRSFHPTWKEAHAHLLAEVSHDILVAEDELEQLKKSRQKILDLEEPQP